MVVCHELDFSWGSGVGLYLLFFGGAKPEKTCALGDWDCNLWLLLCSGGFVSGMAGASRVSVPADFNLDACRSLAGYKRVSVERLGDCGRKHFIPGKHCRGVLTQRCRIPYRYYEYQVSRDAGQLWGQEHPPASWVPPNLSDGLERLHEPK